MKMTDEELPRYFAKLKNMLEECHDPDSLELVSRIGEAWEKSMPQPLRDNMYCPACGRLLCDCEIYCCNCGQRIEWGGTG